MENFLNVYAMFYPALRRLLRLLIAVAVYNSQRQHVAGSFAVADEFLREFDKER